MVSRGFYRHYKHGHVYFVHGVACLKHEKDRRVVIYTSVKTEEGHEGFDFLARDESEFEELVYETDGARVEPGPRLTSGDRRVPRFARIIDAELSIVPRAAI